MTRTAERQVDGKPRSGFYLRALVTVLVLVAGLIGLVSGHATAGGSVDVSNSVHASASFEGVSEIVPVAVLDSAPGSAGCDAACVMECAILGLTCTILLGMLCRWVSGKSRVIIGNGRPHQVLGMMAAIPRVTTVRQGPTLLLLSISRT